MNCLTSVVLAVMLFQQVPRQMRTRQQQAPNAQNRNTDAVATFNGVFKSADKKYVMVDTEEGNSMRMYVTGATKFVRDGKPAKAADFHADEPVTVDTSRDARFNLLAVKIEAPPIKTESAPSKTEDRQPDK